MASRLGSRLTAAPGSPGAGWLPAIPRSLRSANVPVRGCVPDMNAPSDACVLAVQRRDIDLSRLRPVMRMRGVGVHVQMLHLLALQRAARDHPFDRLLDHPLG